MANQPFNIAKGRAVYYATLPGAADAIIVALMSAAEADDTLNNYDDFAAIFAAAGNTEATFTNYGRKVVTTATVTIDDTNNWVDVDIADQTWSNAGGATNNALVKLVHGYDADTAAGTDANITPLSHHDFVLTTDGSSVTAQYAAAGFYRAQ